MEQTPQTNISTGIFLPPVLQEPPSRVSKRVGGTFLHNKMREVTKMSQPTREGEVWESVSEYWNVQNQSEREIILASCGYPELMEFAEKIFILLPTGLQREIRNYLREVQ